MNLRSFDRATFLRDHWQRAPLFIRNPWTAWTNPLERDDLITLATDKDGESRLVTRTKKGWKLRHGPVKPKHLAGKHPWTVLVQAVDHAVPEVAALLDAFRFIPNWRVDDVMVSLANDGGGVGPHFDHYDVFLVQGLGRRRWRVGPRCDADTPLQPHDDLRLLASFEATDEWVLDPGDILYVPPGFAHDGVALGDDCMTYSIGFRAPSRAELVGGWVDHLLAGLPDDDRYTDPGLPLQSNPGEIASEAVARLHAMVTAALGDRAAFAHWFGTFATEPKRDDDWSPDAPITADEVRASLAAGVPLDRNPASRFAYIRHDGGATLFVDGDAFGCTGDAVRLAERLCAASRVHVAELAHSAVADLLVALVNAGSVAFDD